MYTDGKYARTRGKSLAGGYTTIPEVPDPIAEHGVTLEVLGEDDEARELGLFYSRVDTSPYEPISPSELEALGTEKRSQLLAARDREAARLAGGASAAASPAEQAFPAGGRPRSSSRRSSQGSIPGRSDSRGRGEPLVVLSRDGSLIVPTEDLVEIDGRYSWRERALSYIRARVPSLSLPFPGLDARGFAESPSAEQPEADGSEAAWLTGGPERSFSTRKKSSGRMNAAQSFSFSDLLPGRKTSLRTPRQGTHAKRRAGQFSGNLGGVDDEALIRIEDVEALQSYTVSSSRALSRAVSRAQRDTAISLGLPELTGSSDLSEIHNEVLEFRQDIHDLLGLRPASKADARERRAAEASGHDSSEDAALLGPEQKEGKQGARGKRGRRGPRRRQGKAGEGLQTAAQLDSGEEAPPPTGKASVVSTLLNALNTNIGCGSLTIPYDLALMGWVPGLVFLLLMTATSILAGLLLVVSSDYTGRFQYGEVVKKVFNSQKLKILLNILLIIYLAGCCMSNSIITKHNFFWWSCAPDDDDCKQASSLGKPLWWYNNALLWGIMFVVCLPFCCLPNLNLLKFNAYITMVAYLYLVVSCAILFFDSRKHPEMLPDHGPPVLVNRDAFSFISAFPLLSQAFTMHYQILNLYREIRGRTSHKMKIGVYGDLGIMLVSYLIMGVFSYFTMTDALTSDITADLARVSPRPIYLTVESVLILLLMIVHYPLPVFALRRAVESFIWGERQPPLKWSCCISAGVVLMATLVGTFVDSVSTVISFTSSIAGTSLVYLFPAAMCLVISKQAHSRRLRWISIFILTYGAALMALGLFSAVYKEIYLPISRAVA